jgi:hypothetical protein
MSGGHFFYKQYEIQTIADSIQSELDGMGKEIPEEDRCYDNEWYAKYPEDKLNPVYSEETIKEFKEAVSLLKRAGVYAQRIDWFLSGDDGEETFHERLKEDLEKL